MANPVRQHDEKSCRVERLIFPKQLAGKLRPNKLRAAAGSPVHDENGIGRFAFSVFLRSAQCPIMDAQLWESFAGLKFEIANREIAFGRHRIIRGGCDTRGENGEKKCKD